MKRVKYTDDKGFRRCSLLRDNDDERNVKAGLPLEPPPIELLLADIEKALHNELVERDLYSWGDVVASQNQLSAAIIASIRPILQNAFRQKEYNNNAG